MLPLSSSPPYPHPKHQWHFSSRDLNWENGLDHPFLCLNFSLGFCVAGQIQPGTMAWGIVSNSHFPRHLSEEPGDYGAAKAPGAESSAARVGPLRARLPFPGEGICVVSLQANSCNICFPFKPSLSHCITILPEWLITFRSWLALEFLGFLCFPGIQSTKNSILFCFTMNPFEMCMEQEFCRKS